MDDLISRQAAIDIERNATVDTTPSHFEAHQKFMQFMDDAEISSFGRWQWSNGFNTALTAVSIDLKKLPSAQPVGTPLHDSGTDYAHGYADGYRKGLKDEEPERKKGEWIPTRIAKPPKAGQYLVTKQQKTGVCQIATAHYNPSFDEWSGNGNFTKVLAWQQLPTPYTQE